MEANALGAGGNDRPPALIHEARADAEVLHVFGELDFAVLPALRAALAKIVGLGRTIVVDLTRCAYLEASALGTLARARAALGEQLRIEVASDTIVQRVFEITGIGHHVASQPELGRRAFAGPFSAGRSRRIRAARNHAPRRSRHDRGG
jgi:anti-anti-sigma factor